MVHQREQMVREMDILKKSKSKNLLKKGFKKLRVKIQVALHLLCTAWQHVNGGYIYMYTYSRCQKVDEDMVKVTVLLFQF